MERTVDGFRLAYDRVGQGECLVLCHSLGMNREMWFQQVPAFADRYQVFTFDARGHGQSDKPAGPYSIEAMAEDLYKLLRAEGVDRAAVVGLSMGGNTAQALAAAHPEFVRALVLADTTAWYGPEAEKNWEQRAREVETKGIGSIVEIQLGRWFSDGFRASRLDLMSRFSAWLSANDVAGYTATQRALGKVDLRGELERVTCPTLVVVGEHDPATPPSMAEDLHARISGSQLLVLPGARHMSPVEQPERFNAAVLEFLAASGYGAAPRPS